jgi:hypothetical protein
VVVAVAELVAENVDVTVTVSVAEGDGVTEYVGVRVELDVLVMVTLAVAVRVSVAVAESVGVTVGDGVVVDVGEDVGVTLGVADGLAIAYSLKSSEPTYTVPSKPIATDDSTAALVVTDHKVAPVRPFNPDSVPSMQPTYTMPSAPIAGMFTNPLGNDRLQASVPVAATNA